MTAAIPHGLVDCTNEQYHSGPGISKSQLDAIAPELGGSPLKFWDKYINPQREPEEYKHCFAVGDGTHKLVLEPGTFEHTYAVGFDKTAHPDALDTVADLKKALQEENLLTGGAKPELAERLLVEAEYPRERIMMYLEQDHRKRMQGRIPISAKDYKDMLNMLLAIHRDPWAGGLLAAGTAEQSFYVTDPDGLLRKCRTDWITENGQWVVDLKTTDDVSLDGFGTTIARRRYEVQAAWYLDILKMLYGSDAPRGFAFIAAQKTRPYDVAVHWLDEEAIDRGRALYMRDLARLRHCMEHNEWMGAANGDMLKAKLPGWALRQEIYS